MQGSYNENDCSYLEANSCEGGSLTYLDDFGYNPKPRIEC